MCTAESGVRYITTGTKCYNCQKALKLEQKKKEWLANWLSNGQEGGQASEE